MSDKWLDMLTPVIGVAGFFYGLYKDSQNKKLSKIIEEKNNRIQANDMYEKIKVKREIFEDALVDLVSLDDGVSESERQRIFLQTYNKYTSLYNEIEDFCTKLYDGVIESEDYIKETLLPTLNELAEMQVDTYKTLVDYAKKYNLKSINKPDYKAFDKYDKFLVKYNGGETGYFWKKIKNARRDVGFE